MSDAITPKVLRSFRQDFLEATKALAAKYGIEMEVEKINYSPERFEFKTSCILTSKGDVKKQDFELYCKMFGCTPEDYMKAYIIDGKKYILEGFNLNARRYPFILISESGAKIRANVAALHNAVAVEE